MSQREVLLETLYKHLDEFYKLKDQYETEYQKKIIKPILTSSKAKSMKEKRKLLRDAPKARCVNCKRNVGTIFSIKYIPSEDETFNETDSYREFIAKCGDSAEPCPLNINLKVYKVNTFENNLSKLEQEINKQKKEIIYEKNKMVFGYTSIEENSDNFVNLTADLEGNIELYNTYLQRYVTQVENPERQEELKKLIITYGANVEQIKLMIKEYMEIGSQEIVDNVVSMYIDEMIPLNNKIMDFKYQINMVEVHDNVSYLIQRRNTIEQQEINQSAYKTPEQVITNFVVGVVEKSKSKRKTIKATAVPTKQNVTKRATINLEEDSPPIVIESPLVEAKATAGVEAKATAGVEEKATAGVEEKATAGVEAKATAKPFAKPTFILEEEESPPIVVNSSPVIPVSPPLGGENLFSDQALNDAYNMLNFDEQMRILDLEEPQRTEEMRKLINI
jgi:hypothetical protein